MCETILYSATRSRRTRTRKRKNPRQLGYGNLGGTGSFWGEVLVESDLGVGQTGKVARSATGNGRNVRKQFNRSRRDAASARLNCRSLKGNHG